MQVVAFLIIAPLAGGVRVNGFLAALIGSFVYAAINTVLTVVLGVDRGGSYYGLLVSSLMAKPAAPRATSPAS